MDSNFAGVNLEQWQEVSSTPFEEMEELPFPATSFEGSPSVAYEEGQTAAFDEMEPTQEAFASMSEEDFKADTAENIESTEAYFSEAAEYEVTDCMESGDPVTEEYTGKMESGEFQESADFDSDETEETGTQDGEDVCVCEADETGEAEIGEVSNAEKNPDDSVDEELEEERKRAEHEASEAKRKAEWEARQQAKKEAEMQEICRLESMPDEDVMAASMQRVSKDTERLTRRNMKDCVSEYVQALCLDEAAFARLAMHPRKSMVNCFRYINRKAREFVEQEMKDNDIKPENCNGVYGSDIPDDLCYQWAEEYFRDPDAPEDSPEKEEKFEPIPYRGKPVTRINKKKQDKKAPTKKAAEKKADAKKPAEEKKLDNKEVTETEKDSVTGQMSLMDLFAQAEKVG